MALQLHFTSKMVILLEVFNTVVSLELLRFDNKNVLPTEWSVKIVPGQFDPLCLSTYFIYRGWLKNDPSG